VLVIRLFKSTLLRRLRAWSETTTTTFDDFLVTSLERFGLPVLYFLAIYVALHSLTLSVKAQNYLHIATSVVITYFFIRFLSSTIFHLLKTHLSRQERGEEKVKQVGGLMIIINIIVWLLGAVFLIDNLGYDVTTIIAGLGIGGIAIALAAQNILGDLFNYFVIFFDRPFEVGDFIIVDDKLGTIENIGIKTTRIRSLSGEQLVIGNANLTSSRIHNYKRLNRRRVVFSIDVDYHTSLEKLKLIPDKLRYIVEQQDNVVFDRSHFAAFKDWSLRFEVVYHVLSADFNVYMNIQQGINFMIVEFFREQGINFAFPSQTVYVNPEGKLEQGIESLLKGNNWNN
jgi:small-conductance mechanosensitive channel